MRLAMKDITDYARHCAGYQPSPTIVRVLDSIKPSTNRPFVAPPLFRFEPHSFEMPHLRSITPPAPQNSNEVGLQ